MRKILAILVALLVLPVVLATDTQTGIGIDFETEEFAPLIWMCDHRKVIDDPVEPGRIIGNECGSLEQCMAVCSLKAEVDCDSDDMCDWNDGNCILKGYWLIERLQNYAFEGEKLEWAVLVMDKNKIEQVTDVVGTIGASQGEGNNVEVECVRLTQYGEPGIIPEACNARIDEEILTEFDPQTMAYYECTLTVETPDSMYGEYWITVEATDATGATATMDENEYWFLNPVIAVSVDNNLDFGIVRPGTIAYSDTILVGNDADEGSGVLLDMFISGTDFYDPMSQGSRCVITNRLKLGDNYAAPVVLPGNNDCNIGFTDGDDHLCYHATNGAYSTQMDYRADAEGYVGIVYGDTFSRDFYNDAEIMAPIGPYFPGYQPGNILAPGAEIAVTFKLGLPEPCVGDFTDGDIYFWGEAI